MFFSHYIIEELIVYTTVDIKLLTRTSELPRFPFHQVFLCTELFAFHRVSVHVGLFFMFKQVFFFFHYYNIVFFLSLIFSLFTPQNSIIILPLNDKTNLHSTTTEDDDGQSRSVRVWNYLLFIFTIFVKQIFQAGILMLVMTSGKYTLRIFCELCTKL